MTVHLATLRYITQAISRLDRADEAMDQGDHTKAHMEILVARNALRDLAPNDLLIPTLDKMSGNRLDTKADIGSTNGIARRSG